MIFFFRRHWFLLIVFLIFLALVSAIAGSYFFDFSRTRMEWGVTFSSVYAQTELGLDWQAAYLAILDDLQVDNIRLSAYWNQIEAVNGRYDFKDLDWQINEASKRQVKIVLAVGRRLPRWPECHDPEWLKDLKAIDAEEAQLKFVQAVVNRYKDNQQIKYFQVENEPFLSTFGICPPPNRLLLKEEVAQVKKLTAKPILVTDSGELSTWWSISHVGGEILGTTLYRVVYNPQVGYFRWFTPPAFYWLRVQLIKILTPIQKVIVAELQAESWHKPNINLAQMSLADHNLSLSLNQLKENIAFTRRAGFDEAYLWGAEWWYYMKTGKNYPEYWNEAKKLWVK
ncbi:MAG: hypothetical protein WC473_03580 [Patescibacteria group bacterium]